MADWVNRRHYYQRSGKLLYPGPTEFPATSVATHTTSSFEMSNVFVPTAEQREVLQTRLENRGQEVGGVWWAVGGEWLVVSLAGPPGRF